MQGRLRVIRRGGCRSATVRISRAASGTRGPAELPQASRFPREGRPRPVIGLPATRARIGLSSPREQFADGAVPIHSPPGMQIVNGLFLPRDRHPRARGNLNGRAADFRDVDEFVARTGTVTGTNPQLVIGRGDLLPSPASGLLRSSSLFHGNVRTVWNDGDAAVKAGGWGAGGRAKCGHAGRSPWARGGRAARVTALYLAGTTQGIADDRADRRHAAARRRGAYGASEDAAYGRARGAGRSSPMRARRSHLRAGAHDDDGPPAGRHGVHEHRPRVPAGRRCSPARRALDVKGRRCSAFVSARAAGQALRALAGLEATATRGSPTARRRATRAGRPPHRRARSPGREAGEGRPSSSGSTSEPRPPPRRPLPRRRLRGGSRPPTPPSAPPRRPRRRRLRRPARERDHGALGERASPRTASSGRCSTRPRARRPASPRARARRPRRPADVAPRRPPRGTTPHRTVRRRRQTRPSPGDAPRPPRRREPPAHHQFRWAVRPPPWSGPLSEDRGPAAATSSTSLPAPLAPRAGVPAESRAEAVPAADAPGVRRLRTAPPRIGRAPVRPADRSAPPRARRTRSAPTLRRDPRRGADP